MLMLIMSAQHMEESEIKAVENDLRAFFTDGEGAELVVHSLLLGVKADRQNLSVRCVKGEPFIHEEVYYSRKLCSVLIFF